MKQLEEWRLVAEVREKVDLDPLVGDETKWNFMFNSTEMTKSAFPDQNAFHSFKKQRDLFSEVWKEWKGSNGSESFSMQKWSSKVNFLVRCGSHSINYAFLAQLFTQQLLKVSLGFCKEKSIREDSLVEFENADPERLKRLAERVDAPFAEPDSAVGERKQSVGFWGQERFFKDFILAADSGTFNALLKSVALSALAEADTNAGEDTQKATELWKQCCALGKLIGYLEFRPYQQLRVIPAGLRGSIMASRNVEIFSFLKEKLNHGNWITVAWMCQFLSMADPLVCQVQGIHTLLDSLRCRYSAAKSTVLKSSGVSQGSAFHQCLTLSWLFSLPQFQTYLNERDMLVEENNLCSSEEVCKWSDILCVPAETLQCYKWLKWRLRSFALASQGFPTLGGSIRKIKPVTITTSKEQKESNIRQKLMKETESQFFANQPPLVKKAVDVCAECLLAQLKANVQADWVEFSTEEGVAGSSKEFEIWIEEWKKQNGVKMHEKQNSWVETVLSQLLSTANLGSSIVRMSTVLTVNQAVNQFQIWKASSDCRERCVRYAAFSPKMIADQSVKSENILQSFLLFTISGLRCSI